MFNIVDYPPALGECSFCKKHTCGTKEDGTQAWLHSPIELNVGGDLTIGYQCAKLIMNGFGLTVEFVEHEIFLSPTDEQIGDYVRSAVEHIKNFEQGLKTVNTEPSHILHTLDRNGIKDWMVNHNIPFVPQWGEERLREEALKHV